MNETSGLPVLFERARELGTVNLVTLPANASPQAASVPDGMELKSIKPLLDEYLERPQRRVGVATLADLASFIAFANRHKDAASVILCNPDRKAPVLSVAVDYHEEGAGALAGNDLKARWNQFGGKYAFPIDPRWRDWTGISGKPMKQGDFAAFIEDHLLDLIGPDQSLDGDGVVTTSLPPDVARFLALNGGNAPTPDVVVALSKGLDVTAETKVSQKVNLQTGETKLQYEETHAGQGGVSVVVPPLFLIAIPVFQLSSVLYRAAVRLRYRVVDGVALWFPTLWMADEIFDAAVRDAATKAQKETALPLFYGTTL